MIYCERIRALREDHDLTQSAVAKLLRIGQKTYSDYELGKTRIPLESAIKLAKFYGVDMNYICGVSDVKRSFPKKSFVRQLKLPCPSRVTKRFTISFPG